MADVNRILEVELRGQLNQVRGIGVHVVPGIGLRGATMTAAIVSDDPKAFAQKKQHLVVPVVRAQRPTVMEDDGLGVFRTPILVEYVAAVSRCELRHENALHVTMPAGRTGAVSREKPT